MGITLDQLVFDTANPDDGANVGAYLRAGDDGTAIGHVGDALKVDIGSVADLDIRDLTHVSDSVKIGDGTEFLAIDASGNIGVTDAGGSLTVDATDLDIRDLNFATDSVTSRMQDGSGNALSSTAGALDINVASGNLSVDLDHAGDSVRLGDGTTLTNVTTDNRLETFHAPNSSAQNSTASVGLTAVELASSPLSNRKKILVQNNGDKAIYIGGDNTVTTANGICIPKGASFELDWGANVNMWAISSAAAQDVRVMEVA